MYGENFMKQYHTEKKSENTDKVRQLTKNSQCLIHIDWIFM